VTPFGRRLRQLREQKAVTLKEMATEIGVSPAYLSALEHGKRGTPAWLLVQRIISYFNVIWDEAEELERLAQISHPRVTVDTSGLSPEATEYANRLAQQIGKLEQEDLRDMLRFLDARIRKVDR
jgi:transcriptional regulator with XRE-family HTH domain